MTKRSPEILLSICESLAENPNITHACAANGIRTSTYWAWCAKSQAGEPGFTIPEYCGQIDVPFHVGISLARKIAIMEAVSRLEERAIYGHDEVSMYKGEPVWKIDPKLEHLDDATLELCGYPDRYLRDPITGEKVPYKIHHMPPTQLALAVAGAHLPKLYGNHQTIEVNNKVGGVQTVKHTHRLIPASPIPVEALPEPEELSAGQPSFEAVEAEEASFEPVEPEEAQTGPVTPAVPAIAAKPERAGLSELEKDLLAKLAAGPRNPQPSAPVNTGGGRPQADEPIEHGA